MRALGLRTKILLPVAVIIFIVLGISTIVHINNLRRDYLEAVEWRSEALAQNLWIEITDTFRYMTNMQSLLDGETRRCVQLYEANNDDNLTHVAVINASNQFAAHSDREQLNTPVESPRLLAQLQKQEKITMLDGDIYHTLVPIFGTQENVYIGTIDIGFPKEAVDAKIRHVLLDATTLFVLSLLLAFFALSFLLQKFITTPISRLVHAGQQLAAGQLVEIPQKVKKGDEIVVLEAAFNQISSYLQHITEVASHIADGVLDSQVHIRSKQDVLGDAVHRMHEYLNNTATIATHISEGDLSNVADVRSAEDMFGRMMLSMTEGLRTLISQIRISAEQIATTGTQIASLANRDIGIVRNVNGSMEQMVSTMSEVGASIEEVTHNSENLSSSVEQTSTSVAQMAASVRQIASDTSELTQQTDQTIVFLNEAVETLGGIVEHTDASKELSLETLQDATEGQNAVEQVMTSMETIRHAVDMAVESIARFAERSEDIGTILEVIEDITHQTSLLALNASIIAAQAGSHGHAFAVVADEIKSLAQGVGSSTQDIAAIVQTLQEDTKSVVRTIHEGAENVKQGMEHTQQARGTLEKIMSSSQRSSSVVTEIAETLHSLLKNSRKIAVAMRRVSAMTNDIKRATSEQQTSTVQINNAIEHINEMSSQIHLATAEQTTGVRQLLEMAQDVTELAGQNRESSQHIASTTEELSAQSGILLNSIDRFKLNA